jgi:hypothetical protein
MPVKTWQPPPGQQDRERQLTETPAAEPRSPDMLLSAADTNADARPVTDDLSAYGDEDINTQGSER